MACKTETKQIGDHEFSVTQWPAEKAILNKLRLLKIFGAAFAALASKEGEDEAGKLSDSLSIIFDNSQPEEIAKLLKDFIVGVACNGTRITESSFTEIFSGDNLMDAYKVFLFVIQVNYSNLLKGQWANKAAALAKKVSQ